MTTANPVATDLGCALMAFSFMVVVTIAITFAFVLGAVSRYHRIHETPRSSQQSKDTVKGCGGIEYQEARTR